VILARWLARRGLATPSTYLVAAVLGLSTALIVASPTAGASTTDGLPSDYRYDVTTIARVDVHVFEVAEVSPAQLVSVREPCASPPGVALDAFVPHRPRSVAPSGVLDDAVGLACSFSAETRVLMAGGTTKPISDVQVGYWVLAEDPETGERGPRQVTHLWVHEDTLLDLEIDGHDVTTTGDHPFWNATDDQWQRADVLDAGDQVLSVDGALLDVGGLDWGSAHTTTAYNLTVEGIHTYFVAAGDEAVLVHNICGDDLVSDILKTKKGSIRNAELPPGSPSFDDILDMPFSQIEAGARANLPGYKTIKKLLTDRRFNR